MKKNTKHILFFILFILLLLLFLLLAGYQCPLRFFLGIPCPFCGMTRAFLCVLEGSLFGNSGFFTYRTNGSIMGLLRLEFCSYCALS